MTRLTLEDRLERGHLLRMGMSHRGRYWWFDEPYQIVSAARVNRLSVAGSYMALIEFGDSLFGWPGNSQTWTIARGDAR